MSKSKTLARVKGLLFAARGLFFGKLCKFGLFVSGLENCEEFGILFALRCAGAEIRNLSGLLGVLFPVLLLGMILLWFLVLLLLILLFLRLLGLSKLSVNF